MRTAKIIFGLLLVSGFLTSCKQTKNSLSTPTTANQTSVATKSQTASFMIEGMVCPDGCAKTIEKKLSELNGVQKANVDFDKKEATVIFDADQLKSEDLVKTVEATGDGQTYKVSNLQTGSKS